MHRTPHPHGRGPGRPVAALVSVLALLAFACFPVLAQAETVYETEKTNLPDNGGNGPTIPHKNTGPGESSPGADASKAPDGGSGQPGDESSGSQDAASGGGNPSSPGGGGDAQGKAGDGANGAAEKTGGNLQSLQPLSSSADDDSSSPLVPILIAVAVLAAISVGAVLARQRRGSDGRVSPNAS